ncbi:Putative uncharacterized protein [Lactococcus lactis subsp. lactis A12]|uniref:Uncharacterized protein n=1 Tax=Lactococcus lactis subsp. lactis A12 TaxID=1137134 RepID=S6FUD8_LACLL|nr:Putative uncharacterized protein [Lactococcus lactis subsp. lactis A12]
MLKRQQLRFDEANLRNYIAGTTSEDTNNEHYIRKSMKNE